MTKLFFNLQYFVYFQNSTAPRMRALSANDMHPYYAMSLCRRSLQLQNSTPYHHTFFCQVQDTKVYYYDTFGRYVEDKDGNKIYQCAPCTSEYRLTTGNLLEKITKDCGHSERVNKDCGVQILDANNIAILPQVEPIDIKSK